MSGKAEEDPPPLAEEQVFARSAKLPRSPPLSSTSTSEEVAVMAPQGEGQFDAGKDGPEVKAPGAPSVNAPGASPVNASGAPPMNVPGAPPVNAPAALDGNCTEASGDTTPRMAPIFGGRFHEAYCTPKRRAKSSLTKETPSKKGRMELPPFWTEERETKLVMKKVTKMFSRVQQGEAPCCSHQKQMILA